MELIKTKMGRVGNNKKYEGKLVLSIRNTRGTMTDATAKFLGIDLTTKVAFYKVDQDGKKVPHIHIAGEGDDLSGYRRLSKVNGRYGIYTNPFVKQGYLKIGVFEILTPPKLIEGKLMYELKEFK